MAGGTRSAFNELSEAGYNFSRGSQRAPSAGYSQGWAFLALDEPASTARFWDATFPAEEGKRDGFRWQGLFDSLRAA